MRNFNAHVLRIYFQNSVEQRKQKTLCCLCCKSGPISGVIRLNRTGFVPGENIVINAECDNKSRRKMICSYVRLHQVSAHMRV